MSDARMSTFSATELLRPGVLDGVTIMLAHEGEGSPLREALVAGTRALSGDLSECPLPVEDEESLAERLRQGGAPDVLVVDAAGLFAVAAQAGPGRNALSRTLQVTWEVTRVVAGALIEQQRPGRIVFLAPPEDSGSPDALTSSRASRAALENLARTTSIEWARYQITTVAITPGPDTAPDEVAALCAYLACPAGSYFSGCVLALGGGV